MIPAEQFFSENRPFPESITPNGYFQQERENRFLGTHTPLNLSPFFSRPISGIDASPNTNPSTPSPGQPSRLLFSPLSHSSRGFISQHQPLPSFNPSLPLSNIHAPLPLPPPLLGTPMDLEVISSLPLPPPPLVERPQPAPMQITDQDSPSEEENPTSQGISIEKTSSRSKFEALISAISHSSDTSTSLLEEKNQPSFSENTHDETSSLNQMQAPLPAFKVLVDVAMRAPLPGFDTLINVATQQAPMIEEAMEEEEDLQDSSPSREKLTYTSLFDKLYNMGLLNEVRGRKENEEDLLSQEGRKRKKPYQEGKIIQLSDDRCLFRPTPKKKTLPEVNVEKKDLSPCLKKFQRIFLWIMGKGYHEVIFDSLERSIISYVDDGTKRRYGGFRGDWKILRAIPVPEERAKYLELNELLKKIPIGFLDPRKISIP